MAIWKAEELKLLDKMLEDGIELQELHSFLHNRTLDAVYRKCTSLGYGKVKDKEGVTRLHYGVRLRRMKTKTISPMRTAPTVQEPIIQESTKQNLSDVIVAQNDTNDVLLNANTRAVKILTDNSLPVEPDIVHLLSKFILSNNKEIRTDIG